MYDILSPSRAPLPWGFPIWLASIILLSRHLLEWKYSFYDASELLAGVSLLKLEGVRCEDFLGDDENAGFGFGDK